jgi:beta-barrel assembly-enhancing protease
MALGLQACVTGSALDTEKQRGLVADKAFQEKNWPQAQIAYKSFIGGKGFTDLPPDEQYRALKNGAYVGLVHGDKALGYSYLLRSASMPMAGGADWSGIIVEAFILKHDEDAVRGLVILAQRWPAWLNLMDEHAFDNAVYAINRLPRDAQLKALWALYAANFKLKWGFEPSGGWRDLVLLLSEKDRLADAIEVSKRIDDSDVLMVMRADRRFDSVVAANPGHFDVEAAARQELRTAQELSDKNPHVLALKLGVLQALRHLRDYGAMLAASDELVEELKSTNFPQRLYPDYGETYNWVLDSRSVALQRLGKIDDAIVQLQAASRLTEDGAKNASQAINLGELFCEVGRPADALVAVSTAGPVSEYGGMQVESVKLDAFVQLNDTQQIKRSLEFMQAHRADAPGEYVRALILTNQVDLAAQSLIAWVKDPKTRGMALGHVQEFAPHPLPAREQDYQALWRALIDREDVQEAIRKVGRVESYRLELIG